MNATFIFPQSKVVPNPTGTIASQKSRISQKLKAYAALEMPQTRTPERNTKKKELIFRSAHAYSSLSTKPTMSPRKSVYIRRHYNVGNSRLCVVREVHVRDCSFDNLDQPSTVVQTYGSA